MSEPTMSLKVLIADDDVLHRMVLERWVVQWGHTFITAVDGAQAIELLKNQQVDACILDWEMPQMTGVEVCEWIKKRDGSASPRVFLRSTKNQPEDMATAYAAGADDYVVKPGDSKYLRRQLSALAELRRPAVEASTSPAETYALGFSSAS